MSRKRYDIKDKIAAVARLESGETVAEVSEDIGCHRAQLARWRDIMVAKAPHKFPRLSGRTDQHTIQAEDAEVAGEIAERIKTKMDVVAEKLLDRIEELIPASSDLKSMTVALGIIRDKQAIAAGKPTSIYGNAGQILPEDATPAQLEATAEELRQRRLAAKAEEKIVEQVNA